MTTRKTNILVTGGAGYIGSHTVVELLQSGYNVFVLDDFSNSHHDVITAIGKIAGQQPVFFECDMCDRSAMENIFASHRFDAVIHFAARKAVGESVEQPVKYYRNNIVSLLNLLDMMHEQPQAKLVFSSSCAVYGNPARNPVDEQTPVTRPASPYGNTKKVGEEIIEDVCNTSSLKAIALRYFNPIGAHHTALIGELPFGKPNNLVPVITRTCIGKNEALQVFGDDYPTPDGTCIRDYIHVSDVALAHIVAVERLLQKKSTEACEVFNLGTGNGVSVKELISTFEKATGCKLEYTIAPRRAGDAEAVYANTEHANKVLGWKAQHTLEDMLRSAWAWEQHLNAITVNS